MTDAEARRNATDSFALAILACREGYLAHRRPGETAAEYVARRREIGPPTATYPVVTRDYIHGPIRISIHVATEGGGTKTTSSEVTPLQAVDLGARLCALGAEELSSKGR